MQISANVMKAEQED